MGLVSNVIKLGIAKKVIDEARKPENQRRIKEMIASAKSRAAQSRRR